MAEGFEYTCFVSFCIDCESSKHINCVLKPYVEIVRVSV